MVRQVGGYELGSRGLNCPAECFDLAGLSLLLAYAQGSWSKIVREVSSRHRCWSMRGVVVGDSSFGATCCVPDARPLRRVFVLRYRGMLKLTVPETVAPNGRSFLVMLVHELLSRERRGGELGLSQDQASRSVEKSNRNDALSINTNQVDDEIEDHPTLPKPHFDSWNITHNKHIHFPQPWT